MLAKAGWAQGSADELDRLAARLGYQRCAGRWYCDELAVSVLPADDGYMMPLWGARWATLAELDAGTLQAILVDASVPAEQEWTPTDLALHATMALPDDLRPILAQWA